MIFMQSVQNFIDALGTDWQRKACQELLDLQQAAEPNIDGAIKWQNPYFSYNGQALLKWYVAKEWINVYFFKGIQLDDPNGLFEETDNKAMRTVKLFENSELDKQAYEQLVKSALQLNA